MAGSSIPSRGHSSHLTPYLKPTHGCQKTCKLPTTTWNKTHTSCNSRWPGWWHLHLSGRPSLLFPLTAPAARGPGTGCCLCAWLAPSHSSGLNSNRISDKYWSPSCYSLPRLPVDFLWGAYHTLSLLYFLLWFILVVCSFTEGGEHIHVSPGPI